MFVIINIRNQKVSQLVLMASWVKTSQCAGNSSCLYTCVTVITTITVAVNQSLLYHYKNCSTVIGWQWVTWQATETHNI